MRHPSFENPEFIALLREHDIAMVVADTVGKWPLIDDTTSSLVYVRLHGDEELYVSGSTPEALGRWGRKVAAWARGRTPTTARLIARRLSPALSRDVFVYFDNDVKVHALRRHDPGTSSQAKSPPAHGSRLHKNYRRGAKGMVPDHSTVAAPGVEPVWVRSPFRLAGRFASPQPKSSAVTPCSRFTARVAAKEMR